MILMHNIFKINLKCKLIKNFKTIALYKPDPKSVTANKLKIQTTLTNFSNQIP